MMLAPSFVWSVPAGETSWSADMVCMLRAIASQHPDPKLRNPDQLAQRLCPRPFELRDYASAREQLDAAPESWAGYYYVNARTHHIDASFERAVRDGATQVVILGAGFDSRAYRMHAAHPALQFYEVDLPAVIAAKKQRLAQAFIVPHEQVTDLGDVRERVIERHDRAAGIAPDGVHTLLDQDAAEDLRA